MPYIGAAFRTVREEYNELELLVMVTPEFVDAMDAEEVPACGPGQSTESPCDKDLYLRGFLEVPKGYGVSCNGKNCTPHARGSRCQNGNCSQCNQGGQTMTTQPYESIDPGVREPQPPVMMMQPQASKARGTTSNVSTARRTNPHLHQNATSRRSSTTRPAPSGSTGPELIGPVGYDVLK
jgi:pilus assembly protein CpaC